MDEGEYGYLESCIKTRQVPSPRLLIKDHKGRRADGHYKTRLLVPATNFTQGFAKIAYKTIKVIFDNNGVKYCTRTITQASHLKSQLEKLSLTSSNATIASLDVENMYPSIKYRLVLSAINSYSERFNEEEMERIDAALEMLKFRTRNTIISFADKYYECGTSDNPMEWGLTIGGYESAWLADIVASYVLDKAKDRFADTHYFGIYRDDGCVMFKGPRETKELITWLESF